MGIIVVIYSMKIFILLCLVSSSFAWPFIPPNMFSNSWFDDWSSWPSFPSFNSFIPSFFQPASGIKMEVLSVTNQSASANCSWYGSGHGNLTWTVDGEEATSDEINDNGTSSVISLEWEKLNKTVGDTILLSCIGESGGRNNNTGAWLSASQVMEKIITRRRVLGRKTIWLITIPQTWLIIKPQTWLTRIPQTWLITM